MKHAPSCSLGSWASGPGFRRNFVLQKSEIDRDYDIHSSPAHLRRARSGSGGSGSCSNVVNRDSPINLRRPRRFSFFFPFLTKETREGPGRSVKFRESDSCTPVRMYISVRRTSPSCEASASGLLPCLGTLPSTREAWRHRASEFVKVQDLHQETQLHTTFLRSRIFGFSEVYNGASV